MAGCRIPFWLEVPCIYSDDLQSASESASSEPGLTSDGPDASQAPRGTPVVDIGIHATGAVGVGIPQAWLPVYQRTHKPGMQCCWAQCVLSMLKSTSYQPAYKHLLTHISFIPLKERFWGCQTHFVLGSHFPWKCIKHFHIAQALTSMNQH